LGLTHNQANSKIFLHQQPHRRVIKYREDQIKIITKLRAVSPQIILSIHKHISLQAKASLDKIPSNLNLHQVVLFKMREIR
jgi:hypothetical protein